MKQKFKAFFTRLKEGFTRLKDALERDVIRVVVDGRYRDFDGPDNLTVSGKVLGMDKKPHKTVKVGPSNYILVPFCGSVGKNFLPIELLEANGRRTLVYRGVEDTLKEVN